jgi:hypothetical protein
MSQSFNYIETSNLANSISILNVDKVSAMQEVGERLLAGSSLYEFFKQAWPYMEGRMP